MKLNKKQIFFVCILILSINITDATRVNAADCYQSWYRNSGCSKCDDYTYNSDQTDSCPAKHKRQNGIKLCSSCLLNQSSCATYYKRGFSDYNCLAYALGKNGVQSWTWPASWGDGPTLAVFKTWIRHKGYSCTTSLSEVSGSEIIFVYVNNNKVVHFARARTLDGNAVSGAKTISKWGACSLYTTSTINNPYKASSGYGSMKLICYKWGGINL